MTQRNAIEQPLLLEHADDLTSEKFAVPFKRLGNSTRIIDRLRDNARCLLRPGTRPTLSFGLEFHRTFNARIVATGKRWRRSRMLTKAPG